MKATKNISDSETLNPTMATDGIGKADPIPKQGAPAAPTDFVASKVGRGARVQPARAIIKAATGAAKELAASKTYASDFGSSAPNASTLATNVAFAAGWSAQYASAKDWFEYVTEQTRLAWLQANPQLDDFAPVFLYAREHNDSIGTDYASTAKLFDARSEPAVKGAAVKASKKANAKAAKKAAATAATGVAMPAAGSSLKN